MCREAATPEAAAVDLQTPGPHRGDSSDEDDQDHCRDTPRRPVTPNRRAARSRVRPQRAADPMQRASPGPPARSDRHGSRWTALSGSANFARPAQIQTPPRINRAAVHTTLDQARRLANTTLTPTSSSRHRVPEPRHLGTGRCRSSWQPGCIRRGRRVEHLMNLEVRKTTIVGRTRTSASRRSRRFEGRCSAVVGS